MVKITINNLQNKIPVNPSDVKKIILKTLSLEKMEPTRAKDWSSQGRHAKAAFISTFKDGVFKRRSIKKCGEITISFVNDSKIKELNLRYLRKNNPTDVLAFDIAEQPGSNNIFADIVISTDMALRNARIFKTTPFYELYLYLIHGLLHLLGYDDKNKNQRKIMDEKTKYILTTLKLNNNNRYARYARSTS